MPRKKYRNDSTIKHKGNTDQQFKESLFSGIDAKSVEISGYTLGHGAPQVDEFMQEHTLPTGVVDIDETVVLPKSPSKSYHQQKTNTKSRSSQRYDNETVHLPPITPRHYPYEYYYVQPTHHSKYSYHAYPTHQRHQSFHHHHHHHDCRHGETYNPRWWYMPINSVHAPRSYRFLHHHHHYTPPKWYELPSRK